MVIYLLASLPVGDDVTSDFPVAQLTVEDTNPIWVYCRQTGHCEQGMVFAVNPGENFGAFQAKANGTSSATSSASSTATGAASVVTVTATVTVSDGDIVTTTYGSYPGSAEPTSASSSDHLITVGGSSGELTFSPSNISAQVGDTITFQFHQKNHTATQSSFADPCRALSLTSTSGQVGFDSGFMAVAADASTFPTYTVAVNDTTPIWVYCRQTGHCGQGMVFSANAIESGPNNFAAFQAKAKQLNGTSTSSSQSSTSVSPSATTSTTSSAVSTFVNHNGFALGVIALVFGLVL